MITQREFVAAVAGAQKRYKLPIIPPWGDIREECALWANRSVVGALGLSPMLAFVLEVGVDLSDPIGGLADVFQTTRAEMAEVLDDMGYKAGSRDLQ